MEASVIHGVFSGERKVVTGRENFYSQEPVEEETLPVHWYFVQISFKEHVLQLHFCLLLKFQVRGAESYERVHLLQTSKQLCKKLARFAEQGDQHTKLLTYFKSSRSISALSPEISRCNSGAENIRIHSGLMIDLNPLMSAAV